LRNGWGNLRKIIGEAENKAGKAMAEGEWGFNSKGVCERRDD
jgi:hypothetical protein